VTADRRRFNSPMRRTTGRIVDLPTRDMDAWARGETRILLVLLVVGAIVALFIR
jgi:hypothetical protein